MFLTASESKISLTNGGKQIETKNIQWGINSDDSNASSMDNFCAFAEINEEKCATSDGEKVYLYDKGNLLKSFELKATALVYIKRILQLVVYCSNSTHLFFVWVIPPYHVRVHPYNFFDRPITSMFYFPNSSVLLSAGNGIHLTKIIIPDQFKNSEPVPEMLGFEKICDLYEDNKYTFSNQPIVSLKKELFFVYKENKIFIHKPKGKILQTICNVKFDVPFVLSFSDLLDSLIITVGNGEVFVLKSNEKTQEIDFKNLETLIHYRLDYEDVLFVKLFDRNFMIAVTRGKMILTVCIKNNRILDVQRLKINPKVLREGKKYIYIFSDGNLYRYKANFFSHIYIEESNEVKYLSRCQSFSYAARLFYSTKDSLINFISRRTDSVIAKLMLRNVTKNVLEIIYPRDINNDGETIVSTRPNDCLYILFSQGPVVEIDFDPLSYHQKQASGNNHLFRTGDESQIDVNRTPVQEISIPSDMVFVKMICIESGKMPSCIGLITETGVVCLFSLTRKQYFCTFTTNCMGVLTAIYSFTHQLIVISYIGGISAIDPSSQSVISHTKTNSYTSLMMLDSKTIACGSSNGTLEIREFPSLNMICSSQTYSTHHTKMANSPNTGVTPAQKMRQQSNAITMMDLCIPRKLILTASISGEVYLWDENAFPVVHLDLGFEITSCCFLNGKGSIVFSGFNTIFKIPSKILYDGQLVERQLQLDDFDIRIDPFEPNTTNIDINEKTVHEQHHKAIRYSKEDDEVYDFNYNLDQLNTEQCDPFFEDLEVDEEAIPFPKHYFVESPERFRVVLPNLRKGFDKELEEMMRKKQLEEEEERKRRQRKPKISRTTSRRKRDANGNIIGTKSLYTKDSSPPRKKSPKSSKNVQKFSLSYKANSFKSKFKNQSIYASLDMSYDFKRDKTTVAVAADPIKPNTKKEEKKNQKGTDIYSLLNRKSAEPKHRKVYTGNEDNNIKQTVNKNNFLPKNSSNSNSNSNNNNNNNNNKSNTLHANTYSQSQINRIPSVPKTIPNMLTSPRHYETPTTASSHASRKCPKNKEQTKLDPSLSYISPSFDNSSVAEPNHLHQTKAPRFRPTKKRKKAEIEFSPSLSIQKIKEPSASANFDEKMQNYNIDDEIFTKYKIDGIDEAFGGFTFENEDPTKENEIMQMELPPSASLRYIRKYYEDKTQKINDPDQVPILRITQEVGREDVLVASNEPFSGKRAKLKHSPDKRTRYVNYTPHEPFFETISKTAEEVKEVIK